MTCIEASRLIGPFVDDELDIRSAVDVEGHLARWHRDRRRWTVERA